jgi:hypothetical protein
VPELASHDPRREQKFGHTLSLHVGPPQPGGQLQTPWEMGLASVTGEPMQVPPLLQPGVHATVCSQLVPP